MLMDSARSRVREAGRRGAGERASGSPPRPSGATRDEVNRLENQRDQVRGELTALSELLEAERKRLAESLGDGASFRGEDADAQRRRSPSFVRRRRPQSRVLDDDLEAQINEDAAAAAPSAPRLGRPRGGRATLEAAGRGRARRISPPFRPSTDSGPDTEAWHPEQHERSSARATRVAQAKVDAGAQPYGSRVRTGSPEAGSQARRRCAQPRRRIRTTTAVPSDSSPTAVKTSVVPPGSSSPERRPRSSARWRAPERQCDPATRSRTRPARAASATTSRIRSVTCSPASRRARCTRRMTSRASPSASSSGVVSRSRATMPDLSGKRPAGSRVRRAQAQLELALAASRRRRPRTVPSADETSRPFCAAAMTCWVRSPEPGAERGRDDAEDGLGQLADGLEQLDLLHVHLVGDQVGETASRRLGTRGGHRQRRERQARPAPGRLADRVARRADLPGEVHRLDELGVGWQLVGVGPGGEVHAALRPSGPGRPPR